MTVGELLGVIPRTQKLLFNYDYGCELIVWEKEIDFNEFIYKVIPFEAKAFLDSEVLMVYTCNDDALYVDIVLF